MTTDKRRRLYWDSGVFIHYLEKTPDKIDALQPMIEDAEQNRVVIVTSALAMAEVVKLKNLALLEPQLEQLIVDFFEQDYIVIRNVDRWVTQRARVFIRSLNLKAPDAIHLATALLAQVDVLLTYDKKDLIRRSGQIDGLKIEQPYL